MRKILLYPILNYTLNFLYRGNLVHSNIILIGALKRDGKERGIIIIIVATIIVAVKTTASGRGIALALNAPTEQQAIIHTGNLSTANGTKTTMNETELLANYPWMAHYCT
jgi:hypothetical protein